MKTSFSGLGGERRNPNATTEFNDAFYNLMVTVNSLTEEGSLAGIISQLCPRKQAGRVGKTETVRRVSNPNK
jgi:hypothetical protein